MQKSAFLSALMLATVLILIPAGPSAGEEQPAAAPAAAVPAGAPAEEAASPTPIDSLLPSRLGPMERVFWGRKGLMRYLGLPLTEESRETEISIRRGMLTAHQVGGFLTLASMAATAVTGQMIINEDYDASNEMYDRKRLLVRTTIASYFVTAGLAMLTPPPAIRRDQWNTISWHKLLATVHFTGMIVTPLVGRQLRDDRDKEILHQTSGYVTLAALAGAMIVVTF